MPHAAKLSIEFLLFYVPAMAALLAIWVRLQRIKPDPFEPCNLPAEDTDPVKIDAVDVP